MNPTTRNWVTGAMAAFVFASAGDAFAGGLVLPNWTLSDVSNNFIAGRPLPTATDQQLIDGLKNVVQYSDTSLGSTEVRFMNAVGDQLASAPLSDAQRFAIQQVIDSQATDMPIALRIAGDNRAIPVVGADGELQSVGAIFKNLNPNNASTDMVAATEDVMEEIIHTVQISDKAAEGLKGADLTLDGLPIESADVEMQAKILAKNDLAAGVTEATEVYGGAGDFVGMNNLNLTPGQQASMTSELSDLNAGRVLPVDMQVGVVQDLPSSALIGAEPSLMATAGEVPPVIPSTVAIDTAAATEGLTATVGSNAVGVLGGVAEKLPLVQLIYEGGELGISFYAGGLAYPNDPDKANAYGWSQFSAHAADEIGGMVQLAVPIIDPSKAGIGTWINPLDTGGLLFGSIIKLAGYDPSQVSASIQSGIHEFTDTLFDVNPGDDGSMDGAVSGTGFFDLRASGVIQALGNSQGVFSSLTYDPNLGVTTFNFAPVTTANAFAWNAGIQTGIIPAGTTFSQWNQQNILGDATLFAGVDQGGITQQFQLLSAPATTQDCALYGTCGLPSENGGTNLQDFSGIEPNLQFTVPSTGSTVNIVDIATAPQPSVSANPIFNQPVDPSANPFNLPIIPLGTDNPFAPSWQPSYDPTQGAGVFGMVVDPTAISGTLTNAIWNGDLGVGFGGSNNTFYSSGVGFMGNLGTPSNNPGDYSQPENLPDAFSDDGYSDWD